MKKMEVYICLNETNDGLVVLGDVYNAVARKTWAVPIQLPEVDGAFVIPSKADFDGKTYPVTEIAEKAFNKKELTGLIIPNTVTAIGSEAFQKCKINRIVLPDSVKRIGERAFSGCTGLTSVVIPASIKRIEQSVFSDCADLSSVTLPNSITRIEEQAFNGCKSLSSIVIPQSVTAIGKSAFCDCKNLASVNIPNSITRIEKMTFTDCKNLSSIVIPQSVTAIGEWAFSGCESLATVIIQQSVTAIGERAFSGCESLASINIPNSITRIEKMTFSGCKNLSCIVIPQSVTEIGRDAFEGCFHLSEVHYNGTLEQWEKIAFNNNYYNLTNYRRKVYFQGKQVHFGPLPGGVDPLQYAKEFAFLDDPRINTLNFDLYDDLVFNKKNFYVDLAFVIDRLQKKDKSTWERTVKQFLDSLFELDDDLYRLLYAHAFFLTHLLCFYNEIKETTTTPNLNKLGILSCKNHICFLFTEYYHPHFQKENGLHDVITQMPPQYHYPEWYWTWFAGSELGSEIIERNKRSFFNAIRHSRGDDDLEEPRNAPSIIAQKYGECHKGFYFTDNTHSVVTGCVDKTLSSISIPNTVKRIGKFAFHGCRELTNVIIPDSVEVIDWFAFAECVKLTSITLPDSVKEVGKYAFHSCKNLETIRLSQKAYDQCGATLPKEIPYDANFLSRGTKEVEIVITDNMDVRRVKESTDEDVEQLQKYLQAWRNLNE